MRALERIHPLIKLAAIAAAYVIACLLAGVN